MAICTAAQYKTFKGISASTYDAQLAVVIPAAQAAVERFCNRVFDTATFTETFSGDASGFYLLKNAPITSITSVSRLTRNSDGTETATALPVQSYRFDAETGELFLVPRGKTKVTSHDYFGAPYVSNWAHPSFTEGFGNYRVVYVGAYGGSYSMPTDLQLAFYGYLDECLAAALSAVGGNLGVLSAETIGDYSYTRKSETEQRASMERRFGRFRRVVP